MGEDARPDRVNTIAMSSMDRACDLRVDESYRSLQAFALKNNTKQNLFRAIRFSNFQRHGVIMASHMASKVASLITGHNVVRWCESGAEAESGRLRTPDACFRDCPQSRLLVTAEIHPHFPEHA